VSDLYFVAADISQLIHSRKSNIAKAVSVFSDAERARCSVVCPRSNQTQSTHILTVLTMAGVRRLLSSSRAAIALPFLAWLTEQVEKALGEHGEGGRGGGGRNGKRRGAAAVIERLEQEAQVKEEGRKKGRLE